MSTTSDDSGGMRFPFIVLVLTPDDYDRFEEIEYRGRFSLTVPRSVGTAGHGRLALIVRRDGKQREITHLGFARSSGVVSTFDHRVSVDQVFNVGDPIRVPDLRKAMAPIHYGALKSASDDRGGILTPNASANLRKALASLIPDDVWASLVPAKPERHGKNVDTLHGQYDALATGFALAGFDDLDDLRQRSYGAERSVLETIRSSPTEPDLTVRDLDHFAWSRSKAVTEHVRRFEQRGRILDVVNLNATPQEAATGVDLLYFNQTFGSFIGVQYKHAGTSGPTLTRIDDRFRSQVGRMLKLEELGGAPQAPTDFRLGGSQMMFVKFARPVEVDVQVSGMAKGWYVTAAYADSLIQSGQAVGANGGSTFTLDNLGRWLNNDGFAALAREGWIGSIGVDQHALSDYIDQALVEKRSVMLMEDSADVSAGTRRT